MNKVKVLVVEDEIIIADNICDTLEELGYNVTEPAINYTEACIIIEEEKPDIAILDIQLSGKKTGIDVAKKIKTTYNFPFIFLTSNADQATINEAKEVMPPAYLVKPFSKDDLYSAIEITLSNFRNYTKFVEDKTSIFVKHKGKHLKVKLDDILFLKSAHVYIEIILNNNEKLIVRGSLNNFLNNLNSNFIRTHRSYIVNLNYIEEIHNNLILIKELEIPLGSKYKAEILKKIAKN